jgi:hypothetical protein
MAIYAVCEAGAKNIRLIEAVSKAQAIGFVAKAKFSAKTCNTKDIAGYMKQGVQLESADIDQQDRQQ